MMIKPEEKIVKSYLERMIGGEITYEPEGKSKPPDFSINSHLAVEVRRLNQNLKIGNRFEAIETVAKPIEKAFFNILKTFDDRFSGKTFYVSINYKRSDDFIHIKKKSIYDGISNKLEIFLNQDTVDHFITLEVSNYVSLDISPSPPRKGRLFIPAIIDDNDAFGIVPHEYIKNINICVDYKKSIITPRLSVKYNLWWLVLVDHIGFQPDTSDVEEIQKSLSDFGGFSSIKLIDILGNEIFSINKELIVGQQTFQY